MDPATGRPSPTSQEPPERVTPAIQIVTGQGTIRPPTRWPGTYTTTEVVEEEQPNG